MAMNFIKTSLVGTLALAATLMAEQPLLKVGLMTDTHVNPNISSVRLVDAAYRLFKSHQVDLIANMGDICDRFYPEGYKHIRNTFNTVFDGDYKPRELFVYAGHDALDTKGPDEAYPQVKIHLEAKNDPFDYQVIKGFPFITVPQGARRDKYKELLDKASDEHPGKPLFVLDHVPPFNTTYNSKDWGSRQTRELLDNYPNVVQISGHVHGSLRNELNIWQGNFTAVNCGCLETWFGILRGTSPYGKRSDEVMVLSVFKDKLVFKRYSLSDGAEIKGTTPWVVPWPFRKESAPYNHTTRMKTFQKPAFSADAALAFAVDAVPFNTMTVTHPAASPSDDIQIYQTRIARKDANGNWENFTLKEDFGTYYHHESKRASSLSQSFGTAYFKEGETYLVSVTPVNFFGTEGDPIQATWTAPKTVKATTTFETKDPMTELKFYTGFANGDQIEPVDGFFNHKGGQGRIEFPKSAWQTETSKKFRLIIDLRLIQPGDNTWTVMPRRTNPPQNLIFNIFTPEGDSGIMRYVTEAPKKTQEDTFTFAFHGGRPGKIQVTYARIEIVD